MLDPLLAVDSHVIAQVGIPIEQSCMRTTADASSTLGTRQSCHTSFVGLLICYAQS